MGLIDELLGIKSGLFGSDSITSDAISDSRNDLVDAIQYLGAKATMADSDLLRELQRLQAQRRQRSDQQEYEYQQAKKAAQEQAAQRQYNQLRNSLGQAGYQSQYVQQQAMQMQSQPSVFEQMIAQGAQAPAPETTTFQDLVAAQQAALAAMGISTIQQGVPAPKAEPAKPKSKPVDLVEPGQRKIESDE